MANNQQILENIDNFLKGKLDGKELKEFEQQLNSNSDLKQEVEFQSIVREGLMQARQLELKQRMNNIVIEPAFQWTAGKVAAGIAMIGLIGLGTYGFLKSEDNQTIVKKLQNAKNKKELVLAKPIEEVENKKLEKEQIIVISSNRIGKKANKGGVVQLPIDVQLTEEEEAHHHIDVHTPNMPLDFGVNHVDKNAHASTPNGKIEQVGAVSLSTIIPVVENDKDKFHYKYYADKLVLVGDFSKGPYELIELNKNTEKKLYLHYADNFYELHYGTESLDDLVKINQTRLIKELKNKIKK